MRDVGMRCNDLKVLKRVTEGMGSSFWRFGWGAYKCCCLCDFRSERRLCWYVVVVGLTVLTTGRLVKEGGGVIGGEGGR